MGSVNHIAKTSPALFVAPGILLGLALLLACQHPARAQQWGEAATHVNIIGSRVEKLSNAVRVVLKADGVLDAWIDPMDYWEPKRDDWHRKHLKRFKGSLLNARSQIGHMVDVGIYPVSHLVMSVPTDATEGIGLQVSLFLYVPGYLGKLQRGRDRVADWGPWWPTIKTDLVLSDDGRELILTVHTVRPPDEPERPQKTTAESKLTLETSGETCRLIAIHTPLDQLLHAISEQTGVAILLSPEVDKKITANIPAMPVSKLLKALCKTACLDITENEDTYFISSGRASDVSSYWATTGRRMRLNNLPVDDTLEIVPEAILRNVRADQESNALVAYGPPQLLDKIQRDIEKIDVAGKQIRVRVLVVEFQRPHVATRFIEGLVEDGTTGVLASPLGGDLQVRVVDESLGRIRLALQASERSGEVRTHVEPQIVVSNGRDASVFVGKEQFYKFLQDTWRGQELELRKVSVGVALKASPWTGDGRTITVPFDVSADQLTGTSAEGLPLVSRQRAQGSLRVRSGSTLVFAGLRSRDVFRQTQQLPTLKNGLPIGQFLANRAHGHSDSEVAVFMNATVVDACRPAPEIAGAGNQPLQ